MEGVTLLKLRDYQEECIDILDKKGKGKWLVQMPTGLVRQLRSQI